MAAIGASLTLVTLIEINPLTHAFAASHACYETLTIPEKLATGVKVKLPFGDRLKLPELAFVCTL